MKLAIAALVSAQYTDQAQSNQVSWYMTIKSNTARSANGGSGTLLNSQDAADIIWSHCQTMASSGATSTSGHTTRVDTW